MMPGQIGTTAGLWGRAARSMIDGLADQSAPADAHHPPASRFDRWMDACNRLPRPLLALGTLALFGYAMAAPASFAVRMQALAQVPEPLWWLSAAIVSFYFGAREAHYFRERAGPVRTGAVAGKPDEKPGQAAEM